MARFTRLLNLWRRPRLDREFDEELAFHVEMLTEKYLRQGLSQQEAERQARRHAGNIVSAKEHMREARVAMWIDSFIRDLLYGARMFRRQPGATALAVITLSLGIGANIVIYSLLHAAIIRPLPYPSPEQLVGVVDNFSATGSTEVSPTIPEILDVRAESRTLDTISFFDMRDAQVNGGNEPVRAISARVEGQFLRALGVQPALGRVFTDDDHQPGRDRLVVISDAFWRRSFGANPQIVDTDLIVNGTPHTIIGVLPQGFNFDYFTPEPIELYVPYPMTPDYTSRTAQFSSVRRVIAIARLKSSSSFAHADAELDTIARRLRSDHAALYRRGSDGQDLGFSMSVTPLRRMVVGPARAAVWILFGAVGLVLLIACVNTAQFLLAKAVERQPEVVVRSALGAGTGRLLRQFLTEALLFAALATILGLLQAWALIGVLRALLASPSPLIVHLTLNLPVIAFTLAITVAAAIGCGLFPAVHLVRHRFVIDPSRMIGVTRTRTRHVMIAAQVAVSVVLLVSALLLASGLHLLQNAPRGYEPGGVTIMRLRSVFPFNPRGTGIGYRPYLEAIATVPGIVDAAFADGPLPGSAEAGFSIVGQADDAATLAVQRAGWRIVSPRYFATLGIPLIGGRTFTDDDRFESEGVAIINEAMARRYWPGQTPIGKQISSGAGPRSKVTTIVGVVGNVRPAQQIETSPQIYVSYLQQSEPNITLLVKTAPGQAVPSDAIKRAIWSVQSNQPVYGIQPMSQYVDRAVATPRLMARLIGGFAALALVLALLGIYTVVSYLIARRTKEIALRRAIGATPVDVLRLLGLPTIRWTAVGIAAGFVGAAWAASSLGAISTALEMPRGSLQLAPATMVWTTVAYAAVVCAAVLVPAARALRMQPGAVLRGE